MQWIVGGGAFIFGVVVCFVIMAKVTSSMMQDANRVTQRTHALDQAKYLSTLRRELANYLIWHNPQRYLQFYRSLHAETSNVSNWKQDDAASAFKEICDRYPDYRDFDTIGVRDYVLYPDGFGWSSIEDIEQSYRDLVWFMALSAVADYAWKDISDRGAVSLTSERELEHLEKYVKKVQDTQFKLEIDAAMRARAYSKFERYDDLEKEFNNDSYRIVYLHHPFETAYGIQFKKTNRYAKQTAFSDWNEDEYRPPLYSYYETDSAFENDRTLDDVRAVYEHYATWIFPETVDR